MVQVQRLTVDIFLRFPGDTVKILAAAGGSLACQAVALLGLYAYLKALAQNQALLDYPARESPLLFGLVAAATLVLLIGFTLMEYRANLSILRISRRYQHMGTREALTLSSQLPHWFDASNDPHISTRHLRQIVSVDVHHRSRLSRLILLAIIPAVRLVLCLAALLYLNLQFSVFILFAVGLPVAGLYSVGRKVADSITTRESGSQPAYPLQRKLLERSWQDNLPLMPDAITWHTSLGHSGSRFRQYFKRLNAKIYGTFLINIANTVGIMVLVCALGFWTLWAGRGDWSLWLTYLIVLRYFLSSLRSMAQLIVRATRYLRQSQRFTTFLAVAADAVDSGNPLAVPCPEHVAMAFKGDVVTPLGDEDDDD